jgi:hypothetical protein
LNYASNPVGLTAPFNFNSLDDQLVEPDDEGIPYWQIDIPPVGGSAGFAWTTERALLRSLVLVAREVVEGPTSSNFNRDGFEEWWKPESQTEASPALYHSVYRSDPLFFKLRPN